MVITSADLGAIDPDNPPASDLVYTVTALPAHGDIRLDGTALSSNGTFTQADVDNGLVSFSATATGFTTDGLTFTVTSGTDTTSPASLSVTITPPSNSAAVIGDLDTLAYTENSSATVIDSTLTLSDADDAQLVGATATISNGLTSGDVIGFTDQNGISGSYDSSTGVLSLSGTTTVAQYQAALRSVTYHSTSEDLSLIHI